MSPPRLPEAEDLLVRAREQPLSELELQRLEQQLEQSRELTLLFEAGRGFDREGGLVIGDEARMEQLVERTLSMLDGAPLAERRVVAGRPRRIAARYVATGLAWGVLLGAAGAAAVQYGAARFWREPAVEARASVASPAASDAPSREAGVHAAASQVAGRAVVEHPAAEASSVAPELRPLRAPARPRSALQTPSAVPSARAIADAATLFARAGEARRQGNTASAIALYEELCARYPNVDEAADARVILGNLRLNEQAPGAALKDFEGYGAGTLSVEALWGQAQALRQLGRAEERGVLERILSEYPRSPYALVARNRLEQLGP